VQSVPFTNITPLTEICILFAVYVFVVVNDVWAAVAV
jgi:hypothetical protein